MGKLGELIDAGRTTVEERLSDGHSYDPAGQGYDQAGLRSMGKWRFILIRGILGFALPIFLCMTLSDFSKNIRSAHAFHQPVMHYLLGQWIAGFCLSIALGFMVGLLAWRRLVSDIWPGAQPDHESYITTLGPLGRA
jgi:hypothetical protein